MKTHAFHFDLLVFGVILVALGASVNACERNQVTPSDSGTLPVDSANSDVATGGDAVARDAAGCLGDGGCFACPPVQTNDFLNQCTRSNCAPFNNAVRVPRWDGGALLQVQ